MRVAALYVERGGVYYGLPDVDLGGRFVMRELFWVREGETHQGAPIPACFGRALEDMTPDEIRAAALYPSHGVPSDRERRLIAGALGLSFDKEAAMEDEVLEMADERDRLRESRDNWHVAYKAERDEADRLRVWNMALRMGVQDVLIAYDEGTADDLARAIKALAFALRPERDTDA